MFVKFFYALRSEGIRVSLHEYLTLMQALKMNDTGFSMEAFYALCKSILIKSEHHIYRFNQVFHSFFQPISSINIRDLFSEIPEDWLRDLYIKELSNEEKNKLEKLGGLDALLERLKELLEEQDEAHHGGNKWIGTGGTSPFGHGGYHPEGLRIGGESRKNKSGIGGGGLGRYKDLDPDSEINTRNLKLALKILRNFVREGPEDELDIEGTINRTSRNAGMLNISMQANRKNKVRVLMLMDIGGSMDEHIHTCEKLFTAAKNEFKQLEFLYFHNCPYERLWGSNKRRFSETISTLELIRKYNREYKLIFVGDAAMSPYEIYYKGGSVEHYNELPGIHWLELLKNNYPNLIWLNPNAPYTWEFYESTEILRKFTGNRMFPLTLNGIKSGMQCLKNPKRVYKHNFWKSDQ